MLKRLVLGLLMATTLLAQTPERLVETIALHFKGAPPLSEEAVRAHIELKEGQPFNQSALDRSIRALFATGFFENVLATPEDLSSGQVRLNFELTGKLKIRNVYFEGNRAVKAKKLQAEVSLKANSMLDAQAIAADVQKLKDFYQKKRFPHVAVVTRTTPLADAGLADLTFVVTEGNKTKITDIRFEGNRHVKAKDLVELMQTKKASMFSFFTGSGKIEDDAVTEDNEKLTEFYRNKGYLEVAISEPKLVPHKDGVALVFTVTEGALYRVGALSVAGNTLFTEAQLAKAYQLKAGAPFSPAAIEATAQVMRNIYGEKGYLDTAIRSVNTPSSTALTLDVKFNITESQQIKVGSINVEGNTLTKSVVVVRELALAPGDVFSSKKMQTSQERLKNTGYFEDVKITHEPSANDGQHDMSVAVTEGKTGNITFGAGFSSLNNATIFTEFTQGNFDLLNYKNFFRGAGQKLRINLSLAEKSSEAILNFEEPWLFQRRVAGGFSLYRTETKYASTEYNERRTGFEVYLRKRLIELIDGRLGYRNEDVTIFDVSDEASQAIRDEAGLRNVSKVTFGLTRDTRDKVMMPTRGNRIELNSALAGSSLGGDTDYWMVEGRGAQYFTTWSWPVQQYASLLGRTGTMDSFNGKRVPLFDRFFLGGPDSLRGFSYRKVGPYDTNGESLGGKSYAFASGEYSFQLAKPLQFATFYDWGFVNQQTGDFSTSNYVDDWGFGFRIMLMGAPMRIDYAMPITEQENNKNSGRFWFSFGTRF